MPPSWYLFTLNHILKLLKKSGEDQLARVLEKNTELTIQNTDLQKQVQHLQNVNASDGRSLPGLASASKPGDTLESILKQMREAADKRKELEREHAEALTQLREKQNEAQRLTKQRDASSREKSKSYETIEALQSKIRELEKKTELQNVRHEELLLEMASIKRSAQSANTALAAAAAAAAAVNHNSPESGHSTPDSARVDGGGSAGPNRPAVMTSSALDNLGDMHQTTSRVLPHGRPSSQPGMQTSCFCIVF
ncbi:peripheral-type benzodiazepine receptor-associated protein 1-like [Schistocerca americana]|uniref:peripheral-type benzodiazepine receptor-associated protein 1-like n=1 Tax=Schistocerca americana TaxID=7009 RepID=UPI001F4F93A2|nr:peripheral-type benzodiazepine receptor-associated protein 1-like [Schistocerca americana]